MRVRAVLAGLATLLAAACSTGGAARTDRSTARAAAPDLADAGPSAGTLAESWHLDTRPPDDTPGDPAVSRRLVAGQLVVATAAGVTAYDAGTGRPRWHYREPGRRVTGWAATAGSLMVLTDDRNLDQRRSRWTGLAAATGAVEWSERAPGYPLHGDGLDVVAGQGVLPLIRPDAPGELRAVDTRTGRGRWTRHVAERGCRTPVVDQIGAEDTDGSVFALREVCGTRVRVLAVDRAGGVRWARDLDRRGVAVVRDGTTLLAGASGVTIVAADGHVVASDRHRCDAPCRFAVAHDHAVVTSATRALTADLLSGRVETRSLAAPYRALAVADGQVYGVRGNLGAGPVRLLPAALDVIDPATGTVRTGPAPFALAVEPGDAGQRDVSWIAVAGGRLYAGQTRSGRFRTTAYETTRPGMPAELGGVRPSDWPDACAVAPGYRADPASTGGPVIVGTVALRGLGCAYRLADGGLAELGIAWVAPTPDDAHHLLTMGQTARTVPVDGADEAYALGPVLWFRAGRYVVRIGQAGLESQALASAVAKRLRTR